MLFRETRQPENGSVSFFCCRLIRNMIIQDYFLVLTFIITLCKESLQNPKPSIMFHVADYCECGKFNELAPRIVGGKETEPNVFPWMVAILNKGKMHCGGSLINDKYILTAGHCLKWSKKEELSVILGLHNRILIETHKKGGTIADIEKIIIHEKFSSNHLHDTEDIGLIKLKKPVKFSSEIRPICLPKNDQNYSRKTASVTGWGRTSQNGEPSKLLRKAKVTVLANEECRNISSIGKHIIDSMLCAYEDKIDACQGDSGGPLVYETQEGKVEQIGVVSWGIGCAKPGVPGVYTRTTSYLEWIASHTSDGLYCKDPK